jgi:hypothetical protein
VVALNVQATSSWISNLTCSTTFLEQPFTTE